MPGEYSDIYIPSLVGKGSNRDLYSLTSSTKSQQDYQKLKRFAIVALLFSCLLTIVTSVFVFRYETKMAKYEVRVGELEADLDAFFQVLMEELDHDYRSKGDHGTLDQIQSGRADSAHQTPMGHIVENLDVESEAGHVRNKRQVVSVFPDLPNSFGPEVERTEDGVPIVERSYQISSRTSYSTPRPVPRHHAAIPTPESEGLRLYEGLVETGGQNEPKSLDFGTNDGLSPLLPHHKVSAAWSEKAANQGPRSGLQLRSGDSGYDDRYGGPRFANEQTYTRSNSFQSRRPRPRTTAAPQSSSRRVESHSQYQTFGSVSNYNSNVLTSGRGGSGATYHRNSRVAATNEDNYYVPTRKPRPSSSRSSNQGSEYAPLRKLPLGDGQGEVIARVIQDTDDDAPRGQFGRRRERKMGNYRREGQQQYLRQPPVETYRPRPTSTESPSSFTEGGQLNVTIGKSVPFGTYYSSARSNWEINTEAPNPRYRNRY